ncbi:MAG: UrcA family protein [Phenylobacterium sp.]
MTNAASRIAGLATLALAALPIAAISTTAHAAPVAVKVSDIDLNSTAGLAAFHQRAEAAAHSFCRTALQPKSPLRGPASCRAAIRTELAEKLPAAQNAQRTHVVYASR